MSKREQFAHLPSIPEDEARAQRLVSQFMLSSRFVISTTAIAKLLGEPGAPEPVGTLMPNEVRRGRAPLLWRWREVHAFVKEHRPNWLV